MDEKDFRQAMKWYRRAPVTHVAPETGSLGVPLKKDVTHREKARVWFPRQTPAGSDRQQEGGEAGQPEEKPEEIMQGAVTVYQEKKVAAYGRMEKVDEPEAMDAPDVPLADAMSADNPPCDVDFQAVPDGEVLQLGMAEEPVSSEEGAVSDSPFEDMIASVEAGLASMLAEGPPVAGAGQADGEQVDDEVAALLAGMSEEERAEIAGFDLSLLKEDEPAQADGLASSEPALTAGMSEEELAEIAGFDPALLADGSEATMQAAPEKEPESAAVEEEPVQAAGLSGFAESAAGDEETAQAGKASPVEANMEEVPAAEEQIAEAAALAGGTEEAQAEQAAGDEAEVSGEPVVPEAEEALLAGESEPDALEQEAADKAESGFDAESAAADEAAAGEEGTAFGVAPGEEAGAEEIISDEGGTLPAGETLQEAGKDAEQEADGTPEICQEADADVAIEEPAAEEASFAVGSSEEATQVKQAAGDLPDVAGEPVVPEVEDGSTVAVNEHSGETEEASLAGGSEPETAETEQSTADQADDAQAQEAESGVHEALPVEAAAAQTEQTVTVEEDIAETAAEPVAELAGQEPADSLPQVMQAEEVFSREAEVITAASVASETSVKESDLLGMVQATEEDSAADDALAGKDTNVEEEVGLIASADEAEVLPDGEAERTVPVQMALEESKAESDAFAGAEAEVAAEPVTEESITDVQLPEADQPEAAMQAASGEEPENAVVEEEPVQAAGLGRFAESAIADEETAQADEASPVEADMEEVSAAEEPIAATSLAGGAEEAQAERSAGDLADVAGEPVVPEAEDGSAVAVIEHSGETKEASLAGENGPGALALEESQAEAAAASDVFDDAEVEIAAEAVTEESITGVQPETDQPGAAMQAASGEEPENATVEEIVQSDEASPVEADMEEVSAAEEQIAEAAALASGAEEAQAERSAGDWADVAGEPVVPEAEDGSAVAINGHSGETEEASLAGENGPGAIDAGLSDEPGALELEESQAETAAASDAFDDAEVEVAAEAVAEESVTDVQLPEADQPEAAMQAASGEEPENTVVEEDAVQATGLGRFAESSAGDEETAQADEASLVEADMEEAVMAGEADAGMAIEEPVAGATALAGGAEEATQVEQAAGDEADAAGEPVVPEADESGVTAVDENSGKAEAHAGFNAELAAFDGGEKEDAVVAAEAVAEGLLPEAAQAEEESAQVLPEDVFGGEEATLGIEPAVAAGEADTDVAIEAQAAEEASFAVGSSEEAAQAEQAAGDDPVMPETEDGSAVAVNEHSGETEEASLAGESEPEATEAEQSAAEQADDAQAQEAKSGVHEALPVEAEAAQAEQTVTVEEDIAETPAEPVAQASSGAAVLPDPETALADGILLAEGEALPSAPVTVPDGMATGPKGVMPEEDVFRNKMRSHQLNRMAVAEYKVAAAYAREGTPEAYREAARWYIRAAEKGHAVSRFNLGNIYYAGRGVAQDYAKAADWYELAARQGVARAQDNLGLMFFHGRGRPVEPETAVYWFRQAAIQGFAPAQYKLAIHLEAGVGVETNREEALYWYRKAASQGHAQAEKEAARLEAEGGQ